MTFQPTANQVREVAEKYNYTLSKVKDAMVKLGHAEGEVIDKYLQTRGQAVIRYSRKRCQKKNDRRGFCQPV